ncbi:MAG: N-acetylglucosamine-6-phosphate deacetylase [Erysipelothrix sp.]|nr:N-acetylglucosamine-6-phosphate deacetylase [Erysipelothrix sp.]
MIVQSKRVWLGGQFLAAQVEILDDKIVNVYPYDSKTVDKDYDNQRIVPGFIDVHAHGAYGFDTNDANVEGLERWLDRLPEEGITGILPTTVTQSEEVLTNAVANVAKVHKTNPKGAEILGIHFEGPYLDMEYKGAQPPQHIVPPSVEQFKKFQNAAEGLIKIITMATEHDKDFELTQYLSQNGVLVSQGHTGATYEEAIIGIANGANSFTHTFNGMTGLHHRDPNVVGAVMRSDVFAEIISDTRHVHPAVVNALFKTNPTGLMLITDSLTLKGMPKGDYELGGNQIVVDDFGTAYLKGTNTISGSTLKVNEGLRKLVEEVEVPFRLALDAATINPARAINVDDRKGKIKVGYDADLVVLADDYSVVQTYVRGKEYL